MRLIAAALALILSGSVAYADAPVQIGQVPAFTTVDLDDWFVRDSEAMVTSRGGLIALTGASRSSDDDGLAPSETIGLAGLVLNDRAGGTAWAGYFEAIHEANALKSVGLEIAVKNKGEDKTTTPYVYTNGPTGIWFAAGSDASYGGAPTAPSDVAIHIGKNSTTWNTGIVFQATGLTGTDGVTGNAKAISLAKGHLIQWRAPGSAVGANLYSDISQPNKSINQVFTEEGVYWWSGGMVAQFKKGQPPQFGTYQTTIPQAICGYIEVRDTGGTVRKLAALC